ncbi:radical SAM/SPASM domain-containing protein [Leptospira perdikensis]|uniref:Radical SAM/SPASM domain-containing protein n=1 Tax=Leptospira perdikensis TaxID=2484948 RepID=A0A4R9JK20_9LEPT|nr:radical SAM/SPASM domain-containing protein [Leptospira perdikensis]TGL45819.1 radical SAM/SPASM domain-containing protein [Leptospira perdikensis]
MKEIDPKIYKKHHSFQDFKSHKTGIIDYQKTRAVRVLSEWSEGKLNTTHSVHKKENFVEVLNLVLVDLKSDLDDVLFKITPFIAEEMYTYSDEELLRFFYHRYRYDVFPQLERIDNYPPYLQIEPSSICNYRCVFCYQTDVNFFKKTTPGMGQMSLELFRQIVDEAYGNIEFLSLASRGEPLLAKEIEGMLQYVKGKFLNLKVNTNASLLTESKVHALLSGGVKTVVFSADAAEEPLYSQLRVNGKLDKVLKNIEMFQSIRQKDYSDLPVITRVSGVKVTEKQDIDSMERVWGGLVDQVAFVNYNPWENIYEAKPNGQTKACSDLFRRMFIWQDGLTNPCDSDYKSNLQVGKFPDHNISQLWRMERYENLRSAHKSGNRQLVHPCKGCAVV